MTEDELKLKVENFLSQYGLTPTTFGLWAMNDSRFVFDLRDGRACYGRTIRRVCQFMDDHAKKQEERRRRAISQSTCVAPTESRGDRVSGAELEPAFTVK